MRYPESGSFYHLLGVSHNASRAEIRAAFLRLAQRHHPDLNADDSGADRRFKQIRRVYEILSDPIKRAAYDEAPHRFRLSDADIVSDELTTIVTRPMHANPTVRSARARQSAGDVFHPRWLADRRFGRESRLVVAGVITAIVVLSAIPVMMLRSHGDVTQTGQQTVDALRREPHSAAEAKPFPSEPANVDSRLHRVIQSVDNLRDGTAATKAPSTDGPTGDLNSPPEDAPKPIYSIVDELNLSIPGWPMILGPPEVPISAPAIPTAGSEASYSIPTIYSQSVSSTENEWALPIPPPVNSLHHCEPNPDGASADWRAWDRPAPTPEFHDGWNRIPAVHSLRLSVVSDAVPLPSVSSTTNRNTASWAAATAPAMPALGATGVTAASPAGGISGVPQRPLAATGVPAIGSSTAPLVRGSSAVSQTPPFPNVTAIPSSLTVPADPHEVPHTRTTPVSGWDYPAAPLHSYTTGHQSQPEGIPPYVSASQPEMQARLRAIGGGVDSRMKMIPQSAPRNRRPPVPATLPGPSLPRL